MSLKNELRKNINIWQEKQFKNAEEYWDNKLKKILIDESLMGKDHFLIRVSNSVVATRLLEIADDEGISGEYTIDENAGNAADVLFKW